MASRVKLQPPLTRTLERSLAGMLSKIQDGKEGYVQLHRELIFYVSVGYDEYLGKDKDFQELWTAYMTDLQKGLNAAPPGVLYQMWRYMQDNRILRVASGIYTRRGVLMPKPTTHDRPGAVDPDDDGEEP